MALVLRRVRGLRVSTVLGGPARKPAEEGEGTSVCCMGSVPGVE